MSDNKNSYESIKSDVKEGAVGLFFIGGLILLASFLFAAIVVTKNSNLDIGLKTLIICGLLFLFGLLIFNGKFRMWILGGWLILLIAIPVLFFLFVGGYLIYTLFKQPQP